MSAEEFDALTEALASRAISRRRALKLAAASALGAAGLGAAAREAEAAATCPSKTGCMRQCTNTRKTCFCIRTTSGKRRCIHPCCSKRTCSSDSDCRSTEVCMKSPCCISSNGQPTCMTRCSEPIPSYGGCGGGPVGTSSSTAWG